MFENTSVLELIALFVSLVGASVTYVGLRRAVRSYRWMLRENINGDTRRLARSDVWDEAVGVAVLIGHFFLSVGAAAAPPPNREEGGGITPVGVVLVVVHFGTAALITFRSLMRVRDRDWFIRSRRRKRAAQVVMSAIIKRQREQIKEIADREDGAT